jgi:hypothetical protein
MKRLFLSCLVGLVVIGIATARAAEAEHPEFLTSYHVVPRLSTLGVTGGFAGVHERYRLIGEYDLHTGFHHDTHTTPNSFASFENAEIWGSLISDHPTIAIVLDVDEALNLEGLRGEALPVAAPFDVYKFTGKTQEGSQLTLFASLIDAWMYVRGASIPPDGGADFFDYELRMVAHRRPFADHNGDGRVDAADYAALRDRLGSTHDLAAGAVADSSMLLDWQHQFGQETPEFGAIDALLGSMLASEGAASASSTLIPEPATLLLSFLAAGLFCGFAILRRSRGAP